MIRNVYCTTLFHSEVELKNKQPGINILYREDETEQVKDFDIFHFLKQGRSLFLYEPFETHVYQFVELSLYTTYLLGRLSVRLFFANICLFRSVYIFPSFLVCLLVCMKVEQYQSGPITTILNKNRYLYITVCLTSRNKQ